MTVELRPGDCRDVLRAMPDASVDSVVTDPPYALVSIGKRFGSPDAAPAKGDVYARASAGFMGKQWDTGEVAFAVEFWREVYRVLKPGGHVVAFAGSRTYHRLACAIEDAGFEIRDQIMWLYGSGFPKSHDVSKGIDKMLGAEREVVGAYDRRGLHDGIKRASNGDTGASQCAGRASTVVVTAPATPEAAAWAGWGTALKPAHNPIVLARKPLDGTVAANVLAHGVGALNIDATRVPTSEDTGRTRNTALGRMNDDGWQPKAMESEGHAAGRWPANVLHDGSDEVEAAFAAFGERKSGGGNKSRRGDTAHTAVYGTYGAPAPDVREPDAGSASRFFYAAKASKADRAGSKHPTVKPVSLMRWLVRLVTPPGGLVLDPFAGSGTTGQAAHEEGMRCILVEREEEYQADIQARLEACGALSRAEPVAISTTEARDLPADVLAEFFGEPDYSEFF